MESETTANTALDHYIGIEVDEEYYEVALERVEKYQSQITFCSRMLPEQANKTEQLLRAKGYQHLTFLLTII